jgi:hypothetical protein
VRRAEGHCPFVAERHALPQGPPGRLDSAQRLQVDPEGRPPAFFAEAARVHPIIAAMEGIACLGFTKWLIQENKAETVR